MERNGEKKQVQGGAKEMEGPSGTSRLSIFYIRGDPSSRKKDREPGPTFHSTMPLFHSEGNKDVGRKAVMFLEPARNHGV